MVEDRSAPRREVMCARAFGAELAADRRAALHGDIHQLLRQVFRDGLSEATSGGVLLLIVKTDERPAIRRCQEAVVRGEGRDNQKNGGCAHHGCCWRAGKPGGGDKQSSARQDCVIVETLLSYGPQLQPQEWNHQRGQNRQLEVSAGNGRSRSDGLVYAGWHLGGAVVMTRELIRLMRVGVRAWLAAASCLKSLMATSVNASTVKESTLATYTRARPSSAQLGRSKQSPTTTMIDDNNASDRHEVNIWLLRLDDLLPCVSLNGAAALPVPGRRPGCSHAYSYLLLVTEYR